MKRISKKDTEELNKLDAGIYRIINNKNKKCYVGSSYCLQKREKQHFKMLKDGKHHSIKLQRSWNMTKDKNVFKFEVLEETSDNLKVREQYWIDHYNAYDNGYNCSKLVENPKYAKKNLDKIDKAKEANKWFKVFKNKFEANKDRIIISKTLIERCYDKHYSAGVYKLIILALDYFIPKLIDKTKMRIQFSTRKIYVWIVSEKGTILEYTLENNKWKNINSYGECVKKCRNG